MALDWQERELPALTDTEAAFLDASATARSEIQALERQRVTRLRRLLTAVGTLLVLSLVAGSVAVVQQRRATEAGAAAKSARATAETRRLISDATRQVETSREVGLLLAAEAYRRDPGPESLGALQGVLIRTGSFLGLLGAGHEYRDLAWSPGGDHLYGLSGTGVDVLDPQTGLVRPIYQGAASRSLAVHPEGVVVAVTTLTDGVRLIDAVSQEVVSVLQTEGPSTAVVFSPDGNRLAVGDRTGWITVWDWASGTLLASTHAYPERDNGDLPPEVAYPETARHESVRLSVGVEDIRFTASSSALVTTGGISLRVFDTGTLERLLDVPLDREQITGQLRIPARPTDVEIDHRSNTAYVAAGQEVQIVNLATGEVLTNFLPALLPGSAPDQFALALAGDRLLTSTVLGEVNIHDGTTGEVVETIDSEMTGAALSGISLAVSPDGQTLAAAGLQGIKLFALDGRGLISRSIDRPDWGLQVAISSDGDTLLWSGLDRPPVFYDLGNASPEGIQPSIADAFMGFVDDFGHPVVATRALGGQTRGWYLDPETYQPTGQQAFGPATVVVAAESPDGSLVAQGRTSPDPAIVDIRDRVTGELVASIPPAFDDERVVGVSALAWSLDQTRLAVATGPFGVVVYDTSSWQPVSPPIAQEAIIQNVVFDPSGRQLITADARGIAVVRDSATFQPTGIELQLGTTGAVALEGRGLTFTSDGRYLLSTVDEPRLLETESWTAIGDPFPSERGFRTQATQGAGYVPTVVGGKVVIWDLDPSSWPDVACRAAGRNLTEAEWAQFGPADQSMAQTCPQWN
jgi:WD40 repeat protein